ncbi:MAG TPA: hypothetical protein VJ924_08195 [Alphaproteobacteria bacterium]|nr:hypothetical protein [Alphaproteobacteria bacterium]
MIVDSLTWLDRRAAALLAAALAVGLLLPDLASLLRPLLTPAVIGLLASALLRIDWTEVRSHARRPLRAALLLFWLMVATPLIVWAALSVFPISATLATVLVLWASSPVLTAVPAYALLFGIDAALALLAVLATSVLQPLVQPALALMLLGLEIEIGAGALMLRLALIVVASFAIAAVARLWLGRERLRRAGPAIGGVAVVMLIVFAIGVMDGVTAALLADPSRVVLFSAAAFIASFALQALGAIMFWRLERGAALAAALASGNRNMAILIAAIGPAAHPDFGLFFAVVQFPIYLLPAILGPLYRRAARDVSDD